MGKQRKLRYAEFAHRIDLDSFYEGIGWEPIDTDARGNDIGYCPWPDNHSHGDTTGKFAIQRDELVYNCWVCGGGDLLSLVMELYDYDVDDATDFLAQFATSDSRTSQQFVDEFLAYFNDVEKRVETLPYFNDRVLERFDDVPEDWLKSRGIDFETADSFKVKFTEHNVKKPPMKGMYADDEPYSGPAIIFPLFWKGRLVGWQNRWLAPDEERPTWIKKYTNTTGFPKELTIFGFDEALEVSQDTQQEVIAVESVPSALYLWSLGYPAVATFGSDVNAAQMRLLRRFQTGVMLWPDNDGAGTKWLNANTEYLKRYVPVWHLPLVEGQPGADAGDLASSPGAVEDYLDRATQYGVDFGAN